MQNERKNISERLLDFGASSIRLAIKLNKIALGRYIANQLMRASTSSGANYEEACGAESKADFIHKMQLVLKELRESIYWLKLVKKTNIIADENIYKLLDEATELTNIIAKSVITAKKQNK